MIEAGNRIDFTPEQALFVVKQYCTQVNAAFDWRGKYDELDGGKKVERKEAAKKLIPIPPIRTRGAKVMAETVEQMKKTWKGRAGNTRRYNESCRGGRCCSTEEGTCCSTEGGIYRGLLFRRRRGVSCRGCSCKESSCRGGSCRESSCRGGSCSRFTTADSKAPSLGT